jgi:hypothetical protein
MGILLELLFELVLQLVGEVLVDVLGRCLVRVGRTPAGRVVGVLVAAGGAAAGGWWWVPRAGDPILALGLTVAVALAAGGAALHRREQEADRRRLGAFAPAEVAHTFADVFRPWRWSAARLALLAVLNVGLASGLAGRLLTAGAA